MIDPAQQMRIQWCLISVATHSMRHYLEIK